MITCGVTAGDLGFLSSLQRLPETVSPLSAIIANSDPYLHDSNIVNW